jgi:hypothetical protein
VGDHPVATGSPTVVMTIGMVPVAFCAARIWRRRRDDDVHLAPDQLSRQSGSRSSFLPHSKPQ